MSDVLLLVAIKTDQPDIARRITTILTASQPIEQTGDPCAWAKNVEELTADDRAALGALFHPADLERLNIGHEPT